MISSCNKKTLFVLLCTKMYSAITLLYKLGCLQLLVYIFLICIFSRVQLKKSGSRTPRVELEEMGPSLDLVMRRTRVASDDLYKQACKVPRAAKVTHIQLVLLFLKAHTHAPILSTSSADLFFCFKQFYLSLDRSHTKIVWSPSPSNR